MLLAASYFFYGAWDWRFLGLIIFSTLLDYICGRAIATSNDPARRKSLLALSITGNLAVLGFFKYFNFFAESLGVLLRSQGLPAPEFVLTRIPTLVSILLTIGWPRTPLFMRVGKHSRR